MEWKIEMKNEFRIQAVKHSFNEENAGFGIPKFVEEYRSSDLCKKVAPRIGVCETPESGYDWIYAIGDICTVPRVCECGFDIITIPAQSWACFSGASANEMRSFIYGEWFLTSEYEIMPGYTLEIYNDNGNICEIHIPTQKRK